MIPARPRRPGDDETMEHAVMKVPRYPIQEGQWDVRGPQFLKQMVPENGPRERWE